MKSIIFSLFIILIFSQCKKAEKCTDAAVTLKGAIACRDTSLIINSVTYRADNLMPQYAIEGNSICIEYILYDDMKMCPCCGGRKVHIIAVH